MAGPKKKSDAEELELQLHYSFEKGVNIRDRTILINSSIKKSVLSQVEAGLAELESKGNRPITVRICSGGGSVYIALAIVGRLKASPCEIITEGYGCIMSAATLILACGDVRRVSRFAWFMHHEAVHQGVEGRTSEIRNFLKQETKEDERWCEAMASFSNQPKTYWMKKGVGTDLYLSPEALLEKGVVDELI